LLAIVPIIVPVSLVQAEILALLNYGSKPEQKPRKEGIAVIDVDPTSSTFGKMLRTSRFRPISSRIIFITIAT